MNLLLIAQAAESSCTLNGQPIACAELYDKAKPFLGWGIGIIIILAIIAIASFVFWLIMLLHALKHNSPDRNLWLAILALSFFFGFSFIAALVYFFVEKKKAEQASVHPPQQPGANPQSPAQNNF